MKNKIFFYLMMLDTAFCMIKTSTCLPESMQLQQSSTLYNQFLDALEFATPQDAARSITGIKYAKKINCLRDEHFVKAAQKSGIELIKEFIEYVTKKEIPANLAALNLIRMLQETYEIFINPDEVVRSIQMKKFNQQNIDLLHDFCNNTMDIVNLYALPHQLVVKLLFLTGNEVVLIRLIENNSLSISDSKKIYSKCLRNIQTPEIQYNYAYMIIDKEIDLDYEGQAIGSRNRYEIAGELFRKAKTQESKCAYANLLMDERIDLDYEGQPIGSRNRYEVAGALYRQAKTREALCNYAQMIKDEKIDIDFEGREFDEVNRYEVAGMIYRRSNTANALCDYAIMIRNKTINKDFNGNPIKGDGNKIAAMLYRKSGISHAQCNYAKMIMDGSVNKGFKGERIENRCEVAALLFRSANTKDAKCLYANMVRDHQININFEGEEINEENRYKIAECLYRESNTSEAKFSYNIMIQEKKVDEDFNGTPLADKNIFEVVGINLREINSPEAINNYAQMIENGEISVDFEGVAFDEKDRYEVARRLYIKSDLPESKCNYIQMMLDLKISATYENDNILETDQDIYHYVIDFLKRNNEISSREALISFAKSKIIETEDDYVDAVTSCEIALATGQENAEAIYNVLNPLEESTSEEEEENSAEEKMTRNKAKVKKKEEQAQKRVAATHKKFEAFRSVPAKERSEKFRKIVFEKGTARKILPYDIEFKCDICAFEKSAQFEKLTESIINRSNEGHPKILQNKNLRILFLKGEEIMIKHLFSRRITEKDRIIYTYDHAHKKAIVFQVEDHYDD